MPNDMDRAYNAWTGRKTTALRRPKLDCGHPKRDEVHFHLWCDRLSCSTECAEAEHDCEQFKGKSSIDKGSDEAEAFPAPQGPPVATGDSSPEARRQFVADVAAFRTMLATGDIPARPADREPSFTLADMEAASAAVRARRHAVPVEPDPTSISLYHVSPAVPEPSGSPHGIHLLPYGSTAWCRGPGCPRCPADLPAPPVDAALEPTDDRPWWRRMLGGTRG